MIGQILKLTDKTPRKVIENRQDKLRKSILRHEARVGGRLFGPVPKGTTRQFFCLDEYTWIWYEAWAEGGRRKSKITRYKVGNTGIVKSQDGQSDKLISKEETRRLVNAARNYQKQVELEVYKPIIDAVR